MGSRYGGSKSLPPHVASMSAHPRSAEWKSASAPEPTTVAPAPKAASSSAAADVRVYDSDGMWSSCITDVIRMFSLGSFDVDSEHTLVQFLYGVLDQIIMTGKLKASGSVDCVSLGSQKVAVIMHAVWL